MAKSVQKRKFLSLKEKIELIEYAEKSKLPARQLAKKFSVGKSQVSKLLKDKEEIRISLIKNCNVQRKKKFPKTPNALLDQIVYGWYTDVKSKNIPITGALIQRIALDVAQQLEIVSFKASNGWLDKFYHRWNINLKSNQNEESITEKKNNPNPVIKIEKFEIDDNPLPKIKEPPCFPEYPIKEELIMKDDFKIKEETSFKTEYDIEEVIIKKEFIKEEPISSFTQEIMKIPGGINQGDEW